MHNARGEEGRRGEGKRLSFIRAGNVLIAPAAITSVDVSRIEKLEVTVRHDGMDTVISGTDAIETVMTLKPSALEGRRLRWVRHAWAVHNLIGHPLMQTLSFLRLHVMAIRVHDATVPRPKT